MIIDFHTHIFPDKIAERTIASLFEEAKGIYIPVSDGTVSGLLKNMNEWNIDISIVQPIVTKQSQTKNINEWAAEISRDYTGKIISFGGIFPHTDDYKRDIDFVVSLGLKGLKFHAEYQDFIIDGEKMLKIYDYALSKNLIILHHAGFDPAYPEPFKSNPERFAHIIKKMRGGIIIAAHLGGHAQWDDVEKYLCGTDIYLDTSMGFEYFSKEQFLRIVKNHGSDKILFGSDAPWSNAKTEIEHLKTLSPSEISEAGLNAILSGNAKRILQI
ncbi:MAG: amidohydrolase family protein [Oscillospiraceae bacterium]|nr:amidohydrolase family protein [Oscillospiraceae bacterium]